MVGNEKQALSTGDSVLMGRLKQHLEENQPRQQPRAPPCGWSQWQTSHDHNVLR